MNSTRVLTGVAVVITIAGAMGAGQQAQAPSTRGAVVQSTAGPVQCKCAITPWEPEPPCVKTCTGLLFQGTSTDTLRATLKLSDQAFKRIASMKTDGVVSSGELDEFLKSNVSKEFLTRIGNIPPNQLKTVIAQAEKNRSSAGKVD